MVDGGVYPERNQPHGYDQYSEVLRCLIQDFRKDLEAPTLPFVIGVMGVGGPTAKYGPDQQRYRGIHQNFRDAMAAPANDENLKRVFSVLTEECWDMELDALVTRENRLKNEIRKAIKEGHIQKRDRAAKLKAARDKEFTQDERAVLDVGISNAAFHYLGSGKIMALIGKRFAEAIPDSDK